MFVTIINDCKDENAKGRQVARALTLFTCPVNFVGVKDDLEAAGNLLDVLDAGSGTEHVVLVNVAPRARKSWWLPADFPKRENGTPFCHFTVGEAHVFASTDGYTLSLVKKLGLAQQVDIITYENDAFRTSQFRSLTYLPEVAARIARGEALPTVRVSLGDVPDAPLSAWTTDNFGNIKTTLTNKDITGSVVRLFDRNIPLYPRLADIPDGALGAAPGSSGFGDTRFIEVYVQGGSAVKELGV